MDKEAKVLPNALGSIVAYPMFKKVITKLLHVTFCKIIEIFPICKEGTKF
jgi:hypothetical protein